MKYNKGDKVKLRKDLTNDLVEGTRGKVVQVQGRELLIEFQAHTELYSLNEAQVDEYLEVQR